MRPFRACHHLVGADRKAEFGNDRDRGERVIAGDDTYAAATVDEFGKEPESVRSRCVGKADQTNDLQFALAQFFEFAVVAGRSGSLGRGQPPFGDPDHTQTSLSHLVHVCGDRGRGSGSGDEQLRGAFDRQHAVGYRRSEGTTGPEAKFGLAFRERTGKCFEHRRVGGMLQPVTRSRRRAGERRPLQHAAAVAAWHRLDFGHSQSVLTEGAGLVEADDIDPSERFDRARRTDENPVLGEPTRCRLLGQGGDEGKTFGDGRDRYRHTTGDGFAQAGASQPSERCHDQAGAGRDRQDACCQHSELRLQSDTVGARWGEIGGPTCFGVGTHCGHDGSCCAGQDDCSFEQHARPLGERRTRGRDHVLDHRQRLAGQ